MKKVGKIITYILIVLVLVGAIGLIFKFTNGGTTDFKTFYVEIDGTDYLSDTNIVLNDGETVFVTKYVFSSNKAEKHKGYTAKIVPNKTDNTQFYYMVDGQYYLFSDLTDITAGFDIKQSATGFTITNNGYRMTDILQNLYTNKTVTLDESQIDYSNVYCTLVISSYDGESVLNVGLKFNISVTGIKLNKDGIVF